MTGQAIVCKLPASLPIEGADHIAQTRVFGETLVVSKEYKENELGLLFDCETQLSHELCHNANLYRDNASNSDISKKGYIEKDRRVRPIRLQGVKVSGLFLPIKELSFIQNPPTKPGVKFNKIGKIPICQKWEPPQTQNTPKSGEKGKKLNTLVPDFKEHLDTEHWLKSNTMPKKGNSIVITEKLHGTSFRCGNLKPKQKWFSFNNKFKLVIGSRRVVKAVGSKKYNENGYYDSDVWVQTCTKLFSGKLEEGETVYGEIVGFDYNGQPLMSQGSNKKLKSFMTKEEYKNFIDLYGHTTTFSYGCDPKGIKNKVFIYRITRIVGNQTLDLSWSQLKWRCQELGVSHVPEIRRTLINNDKDIENLKKEVSLLTESPSNTFVEHINEGICIRIENHKFTPTILKSKNYFFKILEHH